MGPGPILPLDNVLLILKGTSLTAGCGTIPSERDWLSVERVAMNKLRTLADVLRQAGFARITGLFLIFYLLCSTAVWLSEPTSLTFGDGLWFSFETVSTIGFGDIPAETPVARAITVILSVISIFYIAMLTGVAVNYCNTLIKLRQKDTMARFMDDLEHLEELDRDELANLSRRVREYRRRQR